MGACLGCDMVGAAVALDGLARWLAGWLWHKVSNMKCWKRLFVVSSLKYRRMYGRSGRSQDCDERQHGISRCMDAAVLPRCILDSQFQRLVYGTNYSSRGLTDVVATCRMGRSMVCDGEY